MLNIIQELDKDQPAKLTEFAIEITDLVVRYGNKTAVNGLSLKVPKNTIYGFLGPNGAGKTSVIKTLLGFRKPDSGSARVMNYDSVMQSSDLRACVGYVSETNSLYDNLTIPEINLFYRTTSRIWDQKIVDDYMKLFGLPKTGKVKQLSNGMKRQLSFALALGGLPNLLILDEPTAGLDPIARHELLNCLIEYASAGKSIVFSSHILSEVEAIADWIGIIHKGRLLISSELDQLKASQKIVKLVYSQPPSTEEIRMLRAMPNVTRVEQEGRSVRLTVRQDAEGIAQTIQHSSRDLRDIDLVNLNLEDLFLGYMEDTNDFEGIN